MSDIKEKKQVQKSMGVKCFSSVECDDSATCVMEYMNSASWNCALHPECDHKWGPWVSRKSFNLNSISVIGESFRKYFVFYIKQKAWSTRKALP